MSGVSINLDGLDLGDYIEAVVEQKVAEAVGALGSRDCWLKSQEAAAYLGISVGHLHNLVSRGKLPRQGEKGHGLRFRRADLDAYLAGRRRG